MNEQKPGLTEQVALSAYMALHIASASAPN